MAILKRITTLFCADVHAVLDAVEEPQAQLKLAIRDMLAEINKQKQTLSCLNLKKTDLDSELQKLSDKDSEICQNIDLCFDEDKHALARGLIKKRLQLTKHRAYIKSAIETADKQIFLLNQHIQENQEMYEAMQQKSDILLSQSKPFGLPQAFDPAFEVTEDEIEIAFLNEQRIRR